MCRESVESLQYLLSSFCDLSKNETGYSEMSLKKQFESLYNKSQSENHL